MLAAQPREGSGLQAEAAGVVTLELAGACYPQLTCRPGTEALSGPHCPCMALALNALKPIPPSCQLLRRQKFYRV